MSLVTVAATASTLLFVPGDRPERFAKAIASGADLVVADLEDAVPDGAKERARLAVAHWLGTQPITAVRINAVGTPWHEDDLAMAARRACVVLLPKAEKVEEVAAVAARLAGGSALVALIETASGVIEAAALARQAGVARLAFGSFDLAGQLGVSPDDREAMAPARAALVLASAAGGLPAPVDGVTAKISDIQALREDVAYSRRLGFAGKLCIHPRQVAPAAEGLAPSDAEVRWAQKVVRASEASSGAVAVVVGCMVDTPVLARALRILAAARAPSAAASARGEGV